VSRARVVKMARGRSMRIGEVNVASLVTDRKGREIPADWGARAAASDLPAVAKRGWKLRPRFPSIHACR